MSGEVPVAHVAWTPAHRIVSSRFPPVGLWDRIADPADFEALAALEGLTNPRLRESLGQLALIPPQRRIAGPGTTPVMAAFTHLDPAGSRFSDGRYGVFYAARAIQTAIEETRYHRERFLASTQEAPIELTLRCYAMDIRSDLHDLRGGYREAHDPDDYGASRALGRTLREAGSNGVVYDSVRHAGGECVGVFWPDQVGPCRQTHHLGYWWDGRRISHVVRKTLVG